MERKSYSTRLGDAIERLRCTATDRIGEHLLCIVVLLLTVFTNVNEGLAQSTVSIFTNYLPADPAVAKTDHRTLGVKFWSTQSGTISAITFYRDAISPQGYVASLYSADGTILGSVSMAQESAPIPGWQQANFARPIRIKANTSYIAAYYAPSGQWAVTHHGLRGTVSNGPLRAPASSLVGGNGVYISRSGFPTSTHLSANYFVDVTFTPDLPYLSIVVSPPTPTIPNTTPLGAQVAQVAVTWSDGSPFTGTLSFGPPHYDGGGVYALDSNNNLIINPFGPGVSSATGSLEHVSLLATQ